MANRKNAVKLCENKEFLFKTLKAYKIPTHDFHTSKYQIPMWWEWFIGCGEHGMVGEPINGTLPYKEIPNYPIYVKPFEFTSEYQILVNEGKVTKRYRREVLMDPWGFEEIDNACLLAAEAIGINHSRITIRENDYGRFIIFDIQPFKEKK